MTTFRKNTFEIGFFHLWMEQKWRLLLEMISSVLLHRTFDGKNFPSNQNARDTIKGKWGESRWEEEQQQRRQESKHRIAKWGRERERHEMDIFIGISTKNIEIFPPSRCQKWTSDRYPTFYSAFSELLSLFLFFFPRRCFDVAGMKQKFDALTEWANESSGEKNAQRFLLVKSFESVQRLFIEVTDSLTSTPMSRFETARNENPLQTQLRRDANLMTLAKVTKGEFVIELLYIMLIRSSCFSRKHKTITRIYFRRLQLTSLCSTSSVVRCRPISVMIRKRPKKRYTCMCPPRNMSCSPASSVETFSAHSKKEQRIWFGFWALGAPLIRHSAWRSTPVLHDFVRKRANCRQGPETKIAKFDERWLE